MNENKSKKKTKGKADEVYNKKIKEEKSVGYVSEILPFQRLNRHGGGIKFTDDTYFDAVQIVCKDLENISDDEMLNDLYSWQKFYKMYADEVKLIGINFPCNTKTQQRYFQKKLEKEKNEQRRKILQEKYDRCVRLEKENTDREYYMYFYADDNETLQQRRSSIMSILGTAGLVKEVRMNKLVLLLQKLMNMNTLIINDENMARYIVHEDSEQRIEKLGYDPYLIHAIQPAGGISFKNEKIISTGDGYMAVLYIYKYPDTAVSRHWLTYILNIQNAVCTVDITTENSAECRNNIRRSMSEYGSRVTGAKNDADAIDAEIKRRELEQLFVEVSNMGEVIKDISCHVFLSAKTEAELYEIIDKIQNYLNNNDYRCSIQIGESFHEWQSLFLSKSQQDLSQFKQSGQPFTSTTLAGGYPFHFSSLDDPYGSYFGMTTSSGGGGAVRLDVAAITETRTSYNACIVGNMGYGKSTLLKALIRDCYGRNDYLRIIDRTGEYEELARRLGGDVVYLDGSGGIINIFQLNVAGDTDKESYAMNMSRLSTIYKFLAPEASHAEVMVFEKLVGLLYEKFKIIPSANGFSNDIKIADLPVDAYPICSDFLELVREEKVKETYPQNVEYMNNIERVFDNLITHYGYIFNGHSSVRDLINSRFLVYNIKKLANLKSEIFDVQLFSALSLSWANAVKIGAQSKEAYENGQMNFEDIPRFFLCLDEAHYAINANKPYAVETLTVYAREARKYFAGIWLASQSVRDYVPENASGENVDKIKILFELSQYKYIFKQDNDVIDLLGGVFGASLTSTELAQIPLLEKGRCILCIGNQNIDFNVECTDEELEMFRGGV